MNSKLFILAGGACVAAVAGWLILAPDTSAPALPSPVNHVANAEDGAKAFKRSCASCHAIVTDEGELIAGKIGRTGPNLWRLPSRPAGTLPEYRYSSALKDAGFAWTEDAFIAYVQDPSGVLKSLTGNDKARSKMSFRLRGETAPVQAADIFAYLSGL